MCCRAHVGASATPARRRVAATLVAGRCVNAAKWRHMSASSRGTRRARYRHMTRYAHVARRSRIPTRVWSLDDEYVEYSEQQDAEPRFGEYLVARGVLDRR